MTQTVLRGAPRAVLLDEPAVGGNGEVRDVLAALGLPVVLVGGHSPTLVVPAAPAVGIFGAPHPRVAGCHAWYVGPGPTPSWMRRAGDQGPVTTLQILRLLGTALVQERAAVAFRAAGGGRPAPAEIAFDLDVLRGLDRAVAPPDIVGRAPATPALPRDPLLRRSFAALEACCAPNGAIAAAPRAGPGRPDYWFFWQRDAAAVAVALRALACFGPADVRDEAWARCEGYLDFITGLGRGGDVAASRHTMAGVPVGGYGDPQHDGPAGTVLAVLTLDPGALEIARPFLEHLLPAGPRIGFDLWELTQGRSFHAENLRRRALALAARVAAGVDDALAQRCAAAEERSADQRADFDDSAGGWRHVLDPEPPWFAATSRLDASVLGSALLAFEPGSGPDDPRLAETVRRLESCYADRWPVNVRWRRAGNLGAGIGRFPEDCNDGLGSTGGNPWPVATLWMAQYFLHRGEREQAAGYLGFVLAHVHPDAISEQIDATTGTPRGARGLGWAHAELITTVLAGYPSAPSD
ncbi:glycoside hydrolase family 15 protein [Sporichthya sp.]|uniref:glycoside hydrolase family 15 protein n=1 Tax=Sporichthya sp. TaxID=65475 RepID=UPI0017BA83B7|nr:glycoside hydrolase family 15 protein [Sporichthya sp.]MBA3743774.1 hypothetical protein [Sporichthya sp.]